MAGDRLVVFLHAAVIGPGMWSRQIASLPEGWRALAPELAGHGTRRNERFTVAGAVSEVCALVEEQSLGPAILVGLSLGGYVAMKTALACPDKVSALVLSGSSAPGGANRGPVSWAGSLFAALPPRTADRVASALLRVAIPKEIRDPALLGDAHGAVYRDVARELIASTAVEHIGRYTGPVLIANGEHDGLNRKAERAMLQRLNGARSTPVKGVGHMCFTERFSDILNEFLSDLHPP